MRVATFAEIEDEFIALAHKMVWCNVATVDAQGRPHSRILHSIWDGSTGWIATRRHSVTIPRRSLASWTRQTSVYCASHPMP